MNSKNIIKFETLEELVTYAENLRYAATKYKLIHNEQKRWVDEAAGDAWWEERNNIKYPGFEASAKEQKAYEKARAENNEKRPEEKIIHTYYLADNSMWGRECFYLSRELFEMLDGIWTYGPRWRGSDVKERKGALTLPGMLKRLGKTDVSKKIKETQQREKAAAEKRSRNYDRKQIREASQKLYDLLKNTGHEFDVKASTMIDIAGLIDLQDEE